MAYYDAKEKQWRLAMLRQSKTELIDRLSIAIDRIESLEAELRTLRADYEQMEGHLTRQRDQIQTLRADKERLDWLGVRTGHAQNLFQAWFKCGVGADIRSEIDAVKEKE